MPDWVAFVLWGLIAVIIFFLVVVIPHLNRALDRTVKERSAIIDLISQAVASGDLDQAERAMRAIDDGPTFDEHLRAHYLFRSPVSLYPVEYQQMVGEAIGAVPVNS